MGKNKLIVKEQENGELFANAHENANAKLRIENQEEKKEKEKKTPKIVNKTADTIKGIAEGRKLALVLDRKTLPFVLYLTFLGILYISNTYYTSSTLRQMEKVKNQIRELRYEYVNTEKQLIELSRRNKVMERLRKDGVGSRELGELKESKVPPYQLTITNY